MPHHYQEDPEALAFGRSAKKLRDSLTPRPEALAKLIGAIPKKTVTKSVSPRLFREETPHQLTWLSMLQHAWPRYAFALVAILTIAGIGFGLGGNRGDESGTSVVGTVPKTPPPPTTSGTPVPPLPKDASLDTVIIDITTLSNDDFAEEDSFNQNNSTEDDALLISLYESYDEDTL